MEAHMTMIKEIKTSIDQTLDRWEAAALALEENISATQAAVSARLQTQKEKAAEASEKLKQAVNSAQQLPSEARENIVADLDHLQVQLALGKAEAYDAVLAQKEKIGQAVERVENQIDQFEQHLLGQGYEKVTQEWVRVNLEMQQLLDLAGLRFENEKTENQAQFVAKKQEMLDNAKQFRKEFEEKRTAALHKGSTFASDMNVSFEQVKTAFRNLMT
jgi:hypothetical protein